MAVKEVEGVLVFNNKTRDEMLKRNIGKYSQWKYGLNPAIGEYYDIDYNRELKDLKDGKSLEDFTHDGKSEYSDDIDRKYFSSGNKEKDVYTARDLTPGEYNPWPAFQGGNYLSYIEHGGRTLEDFTHDGKSEYSDTIKKKYFQFGEGEDYSYRPLSYSELNPWAAFQQGTYIQYIDEVFGKDEVMTHVDYVNNLLSGQFIENALRQTEVGVIKDINVAAAMQGIVTTNPNNMSGEDTTLGKIGNSMYARTLYNGAIFNSDRIRAEIRDGENYYTKAYLTPYLVNQYGNNLANVMELSDIMKIGPNETQIREELGKDVKILDGYDGNTADLNSPQFRILNEQIKKAINIRGVDENTLHTQIIEKIDGTTIVRDKKGNDLLLPINVYTPVDGKGYVNISKEKNTWRYKINWEDNDVLINVQNKKGRRSEPNKVNTYNEPDNNGKRPRPYEDFNERDEFNAYVETQENKNTLLSKTSRLFNERAIETMVGRFHTDEKDAKPYFTDTARSYFGNSHGRNLLRLDAIGNPKNDTNGYDNPYCRTWTYHHQYNQIKKLIRPFIDDEDKPYKMSDIQAINKRYRANRKGQNGNFISGSASLEKNGVLQDNGFVRISPHRTEGNEKTDSIKNCMFSIENLAWKDVNVYKNEDNISREQVGPNGGRIMWFPPYNLDFQEGVNVEWNQNTFIGRGEKVYTYTNTERTGTLSFSLLIDHPAVINSMTYGYDGMGQEKDPEADILRFFAGCNLPEISDKPETGSTITTGQTIPNPSTKTGEIKFKIYFPNNFSGLVNRKKNVVYDSFRGFVQPELFEDIYSQSTDGYNEAYGEDYWWQYLLVGNNTCIPSNPELFRGYEMSNEPNKGLYDKGNFMDIALPPCKNKECQIYGEPQINETLKFKDRDGNEKNLPLQYSCSNGLDFNDKTKFVTYQVDYDLRQILINNGSLIDNNSHGLNATFKYNESRKQERGEGEYTFAEVMLAMLKTSNEKYRVLYDKYKDYLLNNCGVDEQQVNKLSEIFGNDTTKYTDIKFRGSADTNDLANATMLGLRRSIATKQMMSRILKGCSDIEDKQVNGDKIDKKRPLTTASDITMKLERCCDVTLRYEIAESEKLSDTANNRGASEAARNTQQIEQNRKDTEENKAVKQEEKAEQEARVAQANVSKPQRNMRYETEAEYFTKLKVEDPVLYRNLQEKFKYFNPAFHSISPEGFNARLTFLHQCTRQGQTYEMSKLKNSANGYTQTASNLAFGRMPVCVIRIGDFINTRAIINSMSISYASSNGIIWDLNQEGAGVQPMYANVSLGITLLGGQSLGAPISRLQNAISFNYYANAEVYDNRADVAEYETVDGKTGVSYKRIWTPVMENTPEDTTQNTNNNTVTAQAENNTDNRKSEVKDNSSFKNLTNEEAADKFAEDPVESQEMSEYVNEDSMVQFVISNYFEPFDITIYCNINYKKEDYDARFYKYYRPVYNSVTKKGKDVQEAKTALENAINVAVDNFIEEHTL